MINPLIYQAPGRPNAPGRAHLTDYGHRTLCGRWIAQSWRRVGSPTIPLCRRCVAIAVYGGYRVPVAAEDES